MGNTSSSETKPPRAAAGDAFQQALEAMQKHQQQLLIEQLLPSHAQLYVQPQSAYFQRTLLHFASMYDCANVCRELVERLKADPNVRDKAGRTPLHLGAREGALDAVRYILSLPQAAANPKDTSSFTPFLYSVYNGHLAIMTALFDTLLDASGISQDDSVAVSSLLQSQTLSDGRTVLHLAAQEGHLIIIQYLWGQAHLDVNRVDKDFSQTPLHLAARYGRSTICDYLIQQCSADAFLTDANGRNALHCAAINDHIDTCRYLVEQVNLDPQQQDNFGRTAVDYANEHMEKRVANYFLKHDRKTLLL